MMLLSDWVFTQQPYVIQRLLRHLIRQPGFKILLSNTTQDRVSTALVPPEHLAEKTYLTRSELGLRWVSPSQARLICQSAEQFPLALISSAQNALQISIGKEIGKPLGEVAISNGWFTPSTSALE